ncbi:MAG: ankyrin repeat domain-containing protein [Candidatus Hydrogenedentota bacterium]
MSEDDSTSPNDIDIDALSLDELRAEGARLLELYHAASDPDELLDLSTRYTKVDMLIDSREENESATVETIATDEPSTLSPVQDDAAPEDLDEAPDEVAPQGDVEEDTVPEDETTPEPFDTPMDEGIESEEDDDDGPISALPPLSAIAGSPDTPDALEPVQDKASGDSESNEDTDIDEDLFDIDKDHGDGTAIEKSPIDIQMGAAEDETDAQPEASSDFDDGLFDTPFVDDTSIQQDADTKLESPSAENNSGIAAVDPAFRLNVPEDAEEPPIPAAADSDEKEEDEKGEDDSTAWEIPAFGDTPDDQPVIPALTNSSTQEDPPESPPANIPPSINETLPNLALGEDKRICARCGESTDIASDRCQSCFYEDASLGIVHAVIAGDTQQVARLLKAKPEIVHTTTSTHGWTLLHMAAGGGNMRLVKILLERGAQVNAQNVHGKTALHYAASKGHIPIIHLLLHHNADKTLLFEAKTPHALAIECGKTEAASALQD